MTGERGSEERGGDCYSVSFHPPSPPYPPYSKLPNSPLALISPLAAAHQTLTRPREDEFCPDDGLRFVHGYNGEQEIWKRSSAETAVKGGRISPAGSLAPGRLRHSTVRPKVDGSSSEWAIVQKSAHAFLGWSTASVRAAQRRVVGDCTDGPLSLPIASLC